LVDPRGSPGQATIEPVTPILQPTDERRRSGSHYTPRSLTAPIVKYALEPAFERIGPDAKPDDVLDLKVCDPAMGSGAFLVEACRALGDRLVQAWAHWPDLRPAIPADEDEDLHARRLVAQRCLYGVDRNPRAVDLARLSLWLATLARDHEFTFLDHALKCGDSLVGLDLDQIGATHWDRSKPPTLVGGLVRQHLEEAEKGRARIRAHADDAIEAELRPQLRAVDARLSVARSVGDGVIAAFFAGEKPKARTAALDEFRRLVIDGIGQVGWHEGLEARLAATARFGRWGRPLHWPVEFPEVFNRENGGFDAIVGNPPFAGKNTTVSGNRPSYLSWLQTLHQGAHGNADLVAHFFLRTFSLLRSNGAFGLIATNTIGQGDTRATGLATILGGGGTIVRATRRLKWPGDAAVVVSVVHLLKGPRAEEAFLDGKPVRRISAYLLPGDFDRSPDRLIENRGKAFQGSVVLGMGFTFDNQNSLTGKSTSITEMDRLLSKQASNADVIFPYIGGEELNGDVEQGYNRWVINFGTRPETEVREKWPDLMAIVEEKVKPDRLKQASIVNPDRWWMHARPGTRLYSAVAPLERIIAIAQTSPHVSFTFLKKGYVYSHTLILITLEDFASFSILQSRIHEIWTRKFAASMKDDQRYIPTDCFATFPFPKSYVANEHLDAAGLSYHAHRSNLMRLNSEGLTKTYNRFHSRAQAAPEIVELRRLHDAVDRAVLVAYGWHDLADRASADFVEQEVDEGKAAKTRFDWPTPFKDEVLARLLALNAERAAAERAAGLMPTSESDDDEDEDQDDAGLTGPLL
jgi:hypothetical protein